MEVTGPIEAILYASSSRTDTDFIVSLDNQLPQSDADRQKGLNPRFQERHQRLAPGLASPDRREGFAAARALVHRYRRRSCLKPGRVYKLDIAIMPTSYLFKKGSRIRVDVAVSDSEVTDFAVRA